MLPQKDVPIARRTNNPIPKKKRSYGWLIWSGLTLGGIILTLVAILIFNIISLNSSQGNVAVNPSTNSAVTNSPSNPSPEIIPSPKQLLGHFAYNEAPLNTLEVVAIASDGYAVKLRSAAAKNYKQMVSDARGIGVDIMAISGFRSKEEQRQLFFEISRIRNQTPAQRAKVSAPAGFSEHHTGYAVDIGDRNASSTNLSADFDRTPVFKWLEQNASKYSFELSFPQNNPQGVMYEPWHWRFVGDDDSLATFYKKN
jgi:zinc D-Ala-D-Ala carboxypeptidase